MKKCDVCGKWFTLSKEHVYQVVECVYTPFTGDVEKTYDAVDCPQCGCQTLLKVRMPKFVKGGAEK